MAVIRWYSGSAYDFFISLLVLHHAADFGLRPYWTAGVRQRISDPHREVLERVGSYASVPLDWISGLDGQKDALPVLRLAADLSPAEQLRCLTLPVETPGDVFETLEAVSKRSSVTAAEKDYLGRTLGRRNKYLRSAGLDQLIKAWKSVEKTSEQLISALHEYYTAFFSEEELRIRPYLQSGLEHAQGLARKLELNALVEELSRGVHFEDVDSARELILVPSYWSTPFVFHTLPAEGKTQVVFGCRPEFQSVAPGAGTPDPLVNALKSLADPTRLQILRHLSGQPLTPTGLSRLLRLRPPTVLHHLHALRLAGLVTIHVSEDGEKKYAARAETISVIFSSVSKFIQQQE